jgi:hypothetical protein
MEEGNVAKGKEEIVAQIVDGLRLTMLHYGLWFKEVEYQLGPDAAMELDERTWRTVFPILMKRLGRLLGFETDPGGIPRQLFDKSEEELREMLTAVSINWLAADGVWFQSVEKGFDMFTAKRCTDLCWSRFSPLEAFHIKRLAGLPEKGGLEALKKALGLRLYANINEHVFERPDERTLIYRMSRCRVQEIRNRKGMEDYPCKSGGIVEYTTFARAMDPAIRTECLACPPDAHRRGGSAPGGLRCERGRGISVLARHGAKARMTGKNRTPDTMRAGALSDRYDDHSKRYLFLAKRQWRGNGAIRTAATAPG